MDLDKARCVANSPDTLRVSGDTINAGGVRIHGGAKHMVVLSSLTRETIDDAVRWLEKTSQLLDFSRPC